MQPSRFAYRSLRGEHFIVDGRSNRAVASCETAGWARYVARAMNDHDAAKTAAAQQLTTEEVAA